jgi:hypothetical protein
MKFLLLVLIILSLGWVRKDPCIGCGAVVVFGRGPVIGDKKQILLNHARNPGPWTNRVVNQPPRPPIPGKGGKSIPLPGKNAGGGKGGRGRMET